MSEIMLYHLLPKTCVGSHLLPLRQLQQRYPDAAETAMKRFKGREQLLQKQVPPLDCSWQDTVSLSLISPEVLVALMQELGVPWHPCNRVAINAAELEPARAVVYPSRRRTPYSPDRHEDFEPFCEETLAGYQTTELTREDWQQALEKGTPVLLFSSVPNVLYTGAIVVSDAPRIVV